MTESFHDNFLLALFWASNANPAVDLLRLAQSELENERLKEQEEKRESAKMLHDTDDILALHHMQ